jgi:hypothetical protein
MFDRHSVVEDPNGNRVANGPTGGADGIIRAVGGLTTTAPTVLVESGTPSVGSLTGQNPVVRHQQPASSCSDSTGR